METYIISLSEYPEEGCSLIKATSEEDAIRQWVEETGTKPDEQPELTVSIATPLLLALHVADAAREAANEAYNTIRMLVDKDLVAERTRATPQPSA